MELQIFNNEDFGDVRVVMKDGVPYFVAADVEYLSGKAA